MRSSIESVKRHLECLAAAAFVVIIATAQQEVPMLRYEPPPNFSRSAIMPPEDYSSNEFNASLQVYPFRSISGEIEQMFRKTLLREWIDPRYQETNVAGQPEFRRTTVRDAQMVLSARFAENIAGIPRQHLRMLILAGGAAAIVDASANNMSTWQRAQPALNTFAASLRVEAQTAVPAIAEGPGPTGDAVAGLYMGTKPKYVVNPNRPVGYGSWVTTLHFYIFSADGRVYRAYDQLSVPRGDVSRFNFDAAQRADPVNSGRYTLTGNQLRILMGDKPPETITTPAPKENRVVIDTVVYLRQ